MSLKQFAKENFLVVLALLLNVIYYFKPTNLIGALLIGSFIALLIQLIMEVRRFYKVWK